jgi:hypothetical protein
VIREKLNYHVEDLAEGWKTFWVFKRPYMKEVIRRAPEAPQTIVDHWYLGKLFGYGDDEIERYSIRFGLFDLDECGIVAHRTRGEGVGVFVKADDESVSSTPIPSLPGFLTCLTQHIVSFLSDAVASASDLILSRYGDRISQNFQKGTGGHYGKLA